VKRTHKNGKKKKENIANEREIARKIMKGKKLNSVALVREGTVPTERPLLVGEVVSTFADRGCRMVSAMDPHGR
jgi:hypothetical protein